MNPKIPISLKLRKKAHKEIAYAQDLVVEKLYDFFPNAVLHGGTAIWRCYNGNRFSEDIDVYIKRNKVRINEFFESLSKQGFQIIKKRIKENSLYSVMKFNTTVVRLEAVFKNIKNFVLREYETADGLFINVCTLNPEILIKEKATAYLKRRKIRDLYDVFFLIRYSKKEKIKKILRKLIKNFKNPMDEGTLKTLIVMGPMPNSKKILENIRKWAK